MVGIFYLSVVTFFHVRLWICVMTTKVLLKCERQISDIGYKVWKEKIKLVTWILHLVLLLLQTIIWYYHTIGKWFLRRPPPTNRHIFSYTFPISPKAILPRLLKWYILRIACTYSNLIFLSLYWHKQTSFM